MKASMSKTWSIRMLILFSIIILCGTASLTSALSQPNRFSGDVMLNGAPAPVGTVIEAYIGVDFRGTTTVEVAGTYVRLPVNGDSPDDGKPITFTVNGLTADQTDTIWMAMVDHVRMLNLTAGGEAPMVTNPNANPSPIAADGDETSQLNVTVTDNCAVGIVTVNLSQIGGHEAQVMEHIGGDVYSTITNASVDTPDGTYDLQVNASDTVGNYNDSVNITLMISDWRDEWMGPDSDGGDDVTTLELQAAIYHWLNSIPVRGYEMTTDRLQEIIHAWVYS